MADEYFSSVVLQLECDGYHGQTSFVDKSPIASNPANNALSARFVSTAVTAFEGNASLRITSATTSYLYAANTSSRFNFGTGDFTWEFWVRVDDANYINCLAIGTNVGATSYRLGIDCTSANIRLYLCNQAGNAWVLNNNITYTVLSATVFTHVALVQKSNVFKMFVGGIEKLSVGCAGLPNAYDYMYIGGIGSGSTTSGYMDSIRITKGVGRYDTPFTPTPFNNKSVTGKVYDDTGAPCSRTVRLYDRTTGMLLGSTTSNASTGFFTFGCPSSGEVEVVVLDDTGGTSYNDRIIRATPA